MWEELFGCEIISLNILHAAVFQLLYALSICPALELVAQIDLNSDQRVQVGFEQPKELVNSDVGAMKSGGGGGGVAPGVGALSRGEEDLFGGTEGDVVSKPEHLAGGAFLVRSDILTRSMCNSVDLHAHGALKRSIQVTIYDHGGRGAIKGEVSK